MNSTSDDVSGLDRDVFDLADLHAGDADEVAVLQSGHVGELGVVELVSARIATARRPRTSPNTPPRHADGEEDGEAPRARRGDRPPWSCLSLVAGAVSGTARPVRGAGVGSGRYVGCICAGCGTMNGSDPGGGGPGRAAARRRRRRQARPQRGAVRRVHRRAVGRGARVGIGPGAGPPNRLRMLGGSGTPRVTGR